MRWLALLLLGGTAWAFECPGAFVRGVKVEHWYLVRIETPAFERPAEPGWSDIGVLHHDSRFAPLRHRLMFAWCADGTVYNRYVGTEKLRRYLTHVYTPKIEPWMSAGVRPEYVALLFSPAVGRGR